MAETLLQKAQRLGIKPAGRQESSRVLQARAEAQIAEAEAQRIVSPLGQVKETIKAAGEITGFTPTGRRIAASIAPYTETAEDLPNVVNELVGGVTSERRMGEVGNSLKKMGANENVAEWIDIALDLPVISLGLSKTISTALGKEVVQKSPELLKFLAKPLSEFAPDALKKLLTKDLTGKARETVEEGVMTVKEKAEKVIEKGKILITPPRTKEQALGQIAQGKAGDIKPLELALGTIDTSGVKTFKELEDRVNKAIPTLAKQVDDELSKDPTIYNLIQLATKETKGGTIAITDYVSRALGNLSELYNKIRDNTALGEINEMIARANREGLTRKEVNDISRIYNIEFGSKAFSKIGDPLTSVNAQAYENTRKGLKNVARQGLGGEEAKTIDEKLSALYDSKRLIDKNVEAVNKLQQRINERGLVEKVGHFVAKYLDILTGGSIRGFVGGLLPRGAGYKVMNAIDIESQLRRNLDIIEKALKEKTDEGLIKILESVPLDRKIDISKYGVPSQKVTQAFEKSINQIKISTKISSDVGDFELGSFGKSALERKVAQQDRFPISEIGKTLDSSFLVIPASRNPQNWRFDNIIFLSREGEGLRAVYTRPNKRGALEIINAHKIPKENVGKYFEDIGFSSIPDRIRTGVSNLEDSQFVQLAYGDKLSLAEQMNRVNRK